MWRSVRNQLPWWRSAVPAKLHVPEKLKTHASVVTLLTIFVTTLDTNSRKWHLQRSNCIVLTLSTIDFTTLDTNSIEPIVTFIALNTDIIDSWLYHVNTNSIDSFTHLDSIRRVWFVSHSTTSKARKIHVVANYKQPTLRPRYIAHLVR